MATNKIQRELPAAAGVSGVDGAERVGPVARRQIVDGAARLDDFRTPAEIGERPADDASGRRSPQADIADFIMPRLAEPQILQSGRALGILEQLVADIVPTFEESHELRSLAQAVLTTEIARRRELIEQLHRGIAT
ncbi:MAG: hypothetical protein JOY90_28255 [Bradyrhizobium sp.]|nr:hypothetical protein [Bradyrhizobium sp.]